MPREIVTETSRGKFSGRANKLSGKAEFQNETCPAPECNLSTKDVKHFVNESKRYMKLFKGAFQRVEQAQKSLTYLQGLLGNATRKNVEQMALGQKEKVRSLQYYVGQSQWETEPVIEIHQGLIGETLGEEDGVALIDESSTVKQGTESVGVAAQYCGSVGKIANGQVGVYLGYASRKGYSLIEGQLFMPEKWFEEEHAEQRPVCGVPEGLVFKTKPEIGLELLKNALTRDNLPFFWVAQLMTAQAVLRFWTLLSCLLYFLEEQRAQQDQTAPYLWRCPTQTSGTASPQSLALAQRSVPGKCLHRADHLSIGSM
jgi:hypothetical protein